MTPNANLHKRKLELIQWLSVIDDTDLLDKIADLKNADSQSMWNEVSEDEKISISKGIEDANSGKMKPHSEARANYEKWL